MGTISRVQSQVFKNYKLIQNPWRAFDVTVWPLVLFFSIVLFAGFMGARPELIFSVVLGLMGWRCIYHFSVDLITSYMDEYWDNSLALLMASPLRRVEFIAGGVITGALKFSIVFTLFYALAWVLFGFHFVNLPVTVFALLSIIVFGIAVGIFALGLIYAAGRIAFPIAFGLSDVLCIFTGVYYPVTIFPEPIKSAALLLPSTYIFEAFRSTLGLGEFKPVEIIISLAAFMLVAVAFNKWAFEYARRKGKLAKLG